MLKWKNKEFCKACQKSPRWRVKANPDNEYCQGCTAAINAGRNRPRVDIAVWVVIERIRSDAKSFLMNFEGAVGLIKERESMNKASVPVREMKPEEATVTQSRHFADEGVRADAASQLNNTYQLTGGLISNTKH